jgi:hypothetical protein
MTLSRTLHLTIATAASAAAVSQSALAAGEPKNLSPFVRAAAHDRVAAQVIRSTSDSTQPAIVGEPKSERPFTVRLTGYATLARIVRTSYTATEPARGEAKNALPFTRLVSG